MTFRQQCLQKQDKGAPDARCLIIGEVAQSHDGSLGMAHAFIDAIADAGADAVKFQTHIAEEESTPGEPWRVKFSPQDATRYDYWKRMEFTADQWQGLKDHADARGLLFLSTPFSDLAVEMLAGIGMKVWKIASGEVGNTPMLEKIASYGDPVILSSGMSDWDELDAAVEIVRQNGNPLAVLQCTSAYPCPPEKVGLNVMKEIHDRYSLPVGLSDHTGKIYAGLAAVTLGAEVLEVHVALSKEMFGPDVPASLTLPELSQLVEGSRNNETMISAPIDKMAAADELANLRKIFTKSVVAASDITDGTVITADHLTLKKPGTGIPASQMATLIGRTVTRTISADEMLSVGDLK
jgi:N,N'-diacetyllegionaminate synthase